MSSIIGNAIIYQVFLSRLKKEKIRANMAKNAKKGKNAENANNGNKFNKEENKVEITENKVEITENKITYNRFIEDIGFTSPDFVKLGDFFMQILSQYPHNIFERVYSKSFYFNREQAKLNINPKYLQEIKDKVIIHPSSLPMLCPPVEWNNKRFGGYLDNKIKHTNLITGSLIGQSHETKNLENLYKAVNILQKIKFGINNHLLDFINNDGLYLLEKLSNEGEELQRELTLKVAKIYSKTPFYLPVNSDWRTRIYTQSFFISYQGGDLASALLNFWDGAPLSEEGKYFFYINGANNHNEDSLSKKSLVERIKWVEDNYDRIINLDKELILSAENKFVFSAFCLNMRDLHYNPGTIIKTPVFLDATCSGVQHLSAMMRDLELGQLVNLSKSNDTDKPADLYSEVVNPVNKALNSYGSTSTEHAVLSLLKFTRKEIKPIVMTKVYNISVYGIAQQLGLGFRKTVSFLSNDNPSRTHDNSIFPISDLEHLNNSDTTTLDYLYEKLEEGLINGSIKNGKKKGKVEYYAPGINGKVILTRKNIYKIAEIINEQIFILFPSLNNIYAYFLDIAKLMVKLNLPLTWITPSGIKITQNYLKSKTTKLAIKLFGVKKTLILRETIKERNNLKQINAIIPNIVHSLDASHLLNVINSAESKGIVPVITVHDCFGTHPNRMAALQNEVKKEFILLYTHQDFLEVFHNRIIQSIRDNNLEIIEMNDMPRFVIFMEESIEIPQLPKTGKLDLADVNFSTYMIS